MARVALKATPKGPSERQIYDAISTFLGVTPGEGDVLFQGTKFSLPESYQGREMEAPRDLKRVLDAQEEVITFERRLTARPLDVAVNVNRVLKDLFGMVKGAGSDGWFGRNAPRLVEVNVGFKETVQVPALGDWTAIPSLPGTEIMIGTWEHPDLGMLGQVFLHAPKKLENVVSGLLHKFAERLVESSIYKGKAINASTDNPEFLSFDRFNPDEVVYANRVRERIEASINLRIEDPDLVRRAGMDVKYSVLFPGPYGTGKSLALALVGRKASEHGWTYLMVRPGKDDLQVALQTAKLYQPCVVAFEDLDTVAGANSDQDSVTKILDSFDGIQAKHTDIITLMTTNHVEDIHKGMLRAGRLDNIIDIGLLDRVGTEKLIRILAKDRLAGSVDFDAVYEVMQTYVPAFIKEAVSRSTMHGLARTRDEKAYTLDTEDLIGGALDVKPQIDAHDKADDHGRYEPPLDRVFRGMIRRSVAETIDSMTARSGAGRAVFQELDEEVEDDLDKLDA